MPALLKSLVLMTRSPPNCLVTVSSTATFNDAASTVNNVTTPIPTISADAVDDVRRGFRIAFCRASFPVMRRTTGSGAPSAAAAGRATTGPNTTKPRIVRNAPSPATPIPAPPAAPATTSATPPAVNTAPNASRVFDTTAAVQRDLAQRGDRRDARGAHCRGDARDERHEHTDRERPDHGARTHGERGGRHAHAGRVHQREQTGGEPDPDGEPEHRRDEPDHERFQRDRAQHLRARGADRAEECRFARALRDQDRERVVDAERADEQRDAGEHQQERLEEVQEPCVERVLVLFGQGRDP